MKFIKLERTTLLRLVILLLGILTVLQACRLTSYTSPVEHCRVQTAYSASRQARFTGRISSRAQTAQNKPADVSQPISPVSLNHATAAELETLPGLGPKKAQAIVDYRDTHGSFQTYTQLLEVDGIGEATLEALVPYLILE